MLLGMQASLFPISYRARRTGVPFGRSRLNSDTHQGTSSMNYLESHLKVVGTRPIRPDGVDKVTGRALFAADTRAAGMLWGRIKRSPHAHARIVSIDTSRAKALPGVMAVLTPSPWMICGRNRISP